MYMVGLAAVCWAIWKGRNRVCFDKKQINNPGDILFSACAFLRYWAGLQRDEDQRQLINAGVDLMMRTAMKILGKQDEPKSMLAIQGGQDDDGVQRRTARRVLSRRSQKEERVLARKALWAHDLFGCALVVPLATLLGAFPGGMVVPVLLVNKFQFLLLS
jgi:hypothetical protein